MSKILNGLVLSGGKSTRMKRDKALIQYHGIPQRDYLVDLLKPYCRQVFISGAQNLPSAPGVIRDHFDLESPLNGILSAFHFDPDASWLTVPIDMPNIDSRAIEYLVTYRNSQKIATCFFDSDGRDPEPLFVIWENRAKPLLFDFFNSGGFSPRKFLQENDVCILKSPSSKILVNINTEEELAAFFRQSGKTLQAGL